MRGRDWGSCPGLPRPPCLREELSTQLDCTLQLNATQLHCTLRNWRALIGAALRLLPSPQAFEKEIDGGGDQADAHEAEAPSDDAAHAGILGAEAEEDAP